MATTYVEGLCIDAGAATPRTLVSVQQCSPADARQDFITPTDKDNGDPTSFQIVHKASGLCLSGEHSSVTKGTDIDLYACEATWNMLWQLAVDGTGLIHSKGDGTKCISACLPVPTPPAPPPTPPRTGPVVINGSALGTRFDGIWASTPPCSII